MNAIAPKEAKRAVIQLTVLRIVVYAILIFLSVLCLFSFVMLFINASRSNGQLQAGFTLLELYEDTNGAGRLHAFNIPTFLAMRSQKPIQR
jgi:ABC-type glycerol-3-phosphate transport system permease component